MYYFEMILLKKEAVSFRNVVYFIEYLYSKKKILLRAANINHVQQISKRSMLKLIRSKDV